MAAEIERHVARDAVMPSANKCVTAAALQALARLALTHPESEALARCIVAKHHRWPQTPSSTDDECADAHADQEILSPR